MMILMRPSSHHHKKLARRLVVRKVHVATFRTMTQTYRSRCRNAPLHLWRRRIVILMLILMRPSSRHHKRLARRLVVRRAHATTFRTMTQIYRSRCRNAPLHLWRRRIVIL
eukprot:PhF_6_TR19968/c0_g3_i1/m.29114